MKYIGPLKIDQEKIGIPLLGTTEYVWVTWNEEECKDDFFKRHRKSNNFYCDFSVWNKNDLDSDYHSNGTFPIKVYEIIDNKGNEYFLVSYRELFEFDDLRDCVCLFRNHFNLMMFFKEYILPFGNQNINYFFG